MPQHYNEDKMGAEFASPAIPIGNTGPRPAPVAPQEGKLNIADMASFANMVRGAGGAPVPGQTVSGVDPRSVPTTPITPLPEGSAIPIDGGAYKGPRPMRSMESFLPEAFRRDNILPRSLDIADYGLKGSYTPEQITGAMRRLDPYRKALDKILPPVTRRVTPEESTLTKILARRQSPQPSSTERPNVPIVSEASQEAIKGLEKTAPGFFERLGPEGMQALTRAMLAMGTSILEKSDPYGVMAGVSRGALTGVNVFDKFKADKAEATRTKSLDKLREDEAGRRATEFEERETKEERERREQWERGFKERELDEMILKLGGRRGAKSIMGGGVDYNKARQEILEGKGAIDKDMPMSMEMMSEALARLDALEEFDAQQGGGQQGQPPEGWTKMPRKYRGKDVYISPDRTQTWPSFK